LASGLVIDCYLSEFRFGNRKGGVLILGLDNLADSPSKEIPRADDPNCFLMAESAGQKGGMSVKIEDGEANKYVPNLAARRTRSVDQASIMMNSLPPSSGVCFSFGGGIFSAPLQLQPVN
jgi:hypothetical protein